MEYVGKGGVFQATGQILMDEWEDKETGKARRKHKFKVGRVELLPRTEDNAPAQPEACGLTPPKEWNQAPLVPDNSEIPF